MVRKLTIRESMSWEEAKKTYKWAFKQYPDVTTLFDNNGYKITMKTENYEKDGSKFKLVDSDTKDITWEQYFNVIDATPFFKNLGGTERVSKSYTVVGYVPVEIVSISPDREKKTVRKFSFELKK